MSATFRDHGIRVQANGPEEQRTTCPKCSPERRKSGVRCLAVNTRKGTWHCHHCSWSGGLEVFERRITEIRALPQSEIPKPTPNPLREKLLAYMGTRGITPEVIDRNGVTMHTRFVAAANKDRNCVAFAYYVDGSVVNVKYRDAEKNFTQSKDGARVFYKLDDAHGSKEVIITEGEMDALSWEVAKYIPALSVPDGAPNAEAVNISVKMRFLDNCIDRLEHVERFILATDNDPNGLRLRDELARRFGKNRCWIVEYPTDCKDSNDVLVKHGTAGLLELYATATPYPVAGSFRASELVDDLEDIYKHGYPEIAASGDNSFDKLLRIAPSTLTVVTGIPNHGKTTWLDTYLCHHMIRNDWRVSFFTPENYPLAVHQHRLIEIVSGGSILPHSTPRINRPMFDASRRFLADRVFYVQPDNELYPLDEILATMTYHVQAYGVNACVLDPWNRIEHHIEKQENETIYTARVLNTIQMFARNNNVAFFIVAHPRKMEKMADDSYRVPTLYDISGSANWANMSDNGVVVYRAINQTTGDTQENMVFIRKVKHKFHGRLGTVHYKYDVRNQRFAQLHEYEAHPWIDPDTGRPATSASMVEQFAGGNNVPF